MKQKDCTIQLYMFDLLFKLGHPELFTITEEELYKRCKAAGLDDVECKLAHLIIIERLKGQELYDAIGYSESQTKRKRKKILQLILS